MAKLVKREPVECLGEIRHLWPTLGIQNIIQQKWIVRSTYSDGSFRDNTEWLDIDHVKERLDGEVDYDSKRQNTVAGISKSASGRAKKSD